MADRGSLLEIIRYRGVDYMKLNAQMKLFLATLPDDQSREQVMMAALADPMKWFCPNGKQEEVILTVTDRMSKCRTPIVLLSAANGIGKTEISINLAGNIIYGAQSGWFLHDPFLGWPNPRLAWYVTTKTCLTDTLIPAIKRYFPAGTYSFDKRGGQIESAIHFENGWEMRMFTTDVDVSQMESASVGLLIIDEPATEAIWRAAQSRSRMGMLTILPMTPLNVEPYILDEIDRNKDSDIYARITASVYDACEERGIRGHLEAKIIDEMVKKYPADEVMARVYGDFMYFKEKIWVNFDEKIHIVRPEDYPVNLQSDYVVQVVDPHDSRPSACLYGAIQAITHSDEYLKRIERCEAQQQYRRIVFTETPIEQDRPYWEMVRTPDIKLEDEPALWAELENSLGIVIVHQRVIDKRFAFQSRMNKTIALVYYEASKQLDQRFHANKRFVYTPSYDLRSSDEKLQGEITYGHNMVMSAFDLLEDGKPGLVIWNTCYHTTNGAKHYIRQRTNSRNNMLIAAGETKIIEKYKDFNDLLRYFLGTRITQTYRDSTAHTTNAETAATKIQSGYRDRANGNGNGSRSFMNTIRKHIRKAR
jgi:hypothetical protein